MTPLTFRPILKRIRWGGRKLGDVLGRPIGPESDYAESWEIADHAHGQSIVDDGPWTGQTLRQVLEHSGKQVFGRHPCRIPFPLLIKFLDAHDWLSLQVHPNDEQARRCSPDEQGKTEAWVILDAEPDSRICAGLRNGIGPDELLRHLDSGTVDQCLNMVSVQPGDCVFIQAGTVHAIGPGILLAEIQQQSDLTYRLHDWGRLGSDGRPRELHIDQALQCIDFDRGPVFPVAPRQQDEPSACREELVHSPWFVIERLTFQTSRMLSLEDRFHILIVLNGALTLHHDHGEAPRRLSRGSTLLLPAELNRVTLVPDETAVLLDVCLP